MKTISLWQPWASAIATGAKTIETRHWPTSYRGALAIHAAKRKVKSELLDFASDPQWCAALGFEPYQDFGNILPFGAIVAVCVLIDCRPTHLFTRDELKTRRLSRSPRHYQAVLDSWTEEMLGDFTSGRFGWVLRDIKPLIEPILYRGEQGLFEIPDSVVLRGLMSKEQKMSSAIANAIASTTRRCRICGCTDDDCRQCIEKTGEPCYWVEPDLCSACAVELSR